MLYYRLPDWPMSTSPKRLSLVTNSVNRKAGQVGGNCGETVESGVEIADSWDLYPRLQHE